MFLLESPHRGDSNEYTQYTIFNIKKENHLHYRKTAAMGLFSKELKNEFETAMVNEPSVFEPLKFHYTSNNGLSFHRNVTQRVLSPPQVEYSLTVDVRQIS